MNLPPPTSAKQMPTQSRFQRGLNGIEPTFDLLCGTHVCDVLRARTVLEEKRLRSSPCDKFTGEELLYLFYGKPSFRPKAIREGSRMSPHYPVCFVVNLQETIQLKRVFPFDSGAFPQRYMEFFHEQMPLDDFLMPAEWDSARKIVEAFFASNRDYYDSRPLQTFRASKTIETTSYHELVRAFGSGQRMNGDDRLVAIEMQAIGEIPLDTKHIRRIIVPDKALELVDFASALEECGIPFDHYSTGPLSPSECHAFVNAAVRTINQLPP